MGASACLPALGADAADKSNASTGMVAVPLAAAMPRRGYRKGQLPGGLPHWFRRETIRRLIYLKINHRLSRNSSEQ